MIPIIAIRPQPGCAATVAAGKAAGLSIEPAPLFAIEPVAWQPPAPSSVDALLVGSANAFRHAGPDLAGFRHQPVHAVGAATAEAARTAGLAVASVGTGGLQAVIDALAMALPDAARHQPVRLLRLAGEEHVALRAPSGLFILTRIVYRSVARPVPDNLAARLGNEGALVLLHSAVAAQHFASEVDRLRLDRGRIAIAALAPRITAAAGAGWAACQTAPQMCDEALLALAQQMGYR